MSQFNRLSEEDRQHWKEAIDYALDDLHHHGWAAKNNSTRFDVAYNGLFIPPKQVVALAFDYLDKKGIDTNLKNIKGGDQYTNSFLKEFGLEIMQKKRKLQAYLQAIEVSDGWKNNYNDFVPKFVNEAEKGKDWSDWDKRVFNEFFEKSNDQCVSSLRQGYFTHEERAAIKSNWNQVALFLKQISMSQEKPLFDVFDELRNLLRKYTKQDRRAATYRLVASLQPRNLCTVVNHDRLNELIRFLNQFVENADLKISNNWFQSSHEVLSFFITESGKDLKDIVTYPWQLLEYFKGNKHVDNNDMSEQQNDDVMMELQLLKYKKQIILQGPPGTGKTRAAKRIAKSLLNIDGQKVYQKPKKIDKEDLRRLINKGLKLRSVSDYSDYEVMEISDSNFKVKTLKTGKVYPASFERIISYYEGEKWSKVGTIKWGNDSYEAALAKYVYDNIDIEDHAETIQNTDRLRILQFHPSYTYEDFVRGIASEAKGDSIVYQAQNRTLVEMANKAALNPDHNYVLILDEINRANLSAVLGELIYALEYRGKEVNSMYEVNQSNKITLPNNLYIIGTMNTADRSVGHIDYAIRRRFAFVDVPPEKLIDTDEIWFNTSGYEKVEQLFNKTNISSEFDAKDVQLGHSYFIVKKSDAVDTVRRDELFKLKMEYEIKPILREYVKDGILIGKVGGMEVLDYINGL